MRHKGFFFFLIISIFIDLLFASVAEHTNVHPTGQVGLIDNYSANTLGFTKLLFSVSGDFAYDAKLVPQMEKGDGRGGYDTFHPSAILYGIYPVLAFGVTDFLDISFLQPFYLDIIPLDGLPPSGGPGDLSLTLKCRVPGRKSRLIEGALCSQFTFANGHKTNGFSVRHGYYLKKAPESVLSTTFDPVAFFSAGKPTWSLLALGTLGKRRFFLHANLGACITFNKRLDNALAGGMGVEWYPMKEIGLFAELYAEPRLKNLIDGVTITEDPFHVSPGITFHAPGGTTLSIGGSFSLTSRKEFFYSDTMRGITMITRMEPQWRLFVQLGWNGFIIAGDRDNDLLLDRDDLCPDVKEDVDGFEDHDGCPDVDNDQDKIPDEQDSCKNIPEDLDGFSDVDGCPDPDNDRDGITDSLDTCPDNAEDRDGFQDTDGCPDDDNDEDGIPDTLDKCVGTAEDKDGFEDGDGCPDSDNDMDAVPDSIDECPDTAGVSEEKGCPKPREKAKEIRRGRLILSGVKFDGGSADLTQGSTEDIDRLFESLTDWPEVQLEIQAHTDNSAPAAASLSLSQKRAEIVRDYLIQKGIAPSRLTAVGKGSDEPIADNKSIQGRRLNSRIEIHRND